MSNINPIIELDKITSISLNSSSYGKDINERFENIDKNFKKILETDYLVGAKGDSVGLMECKLSGIITDNTQYDLYDYNDVQITSTMLYNLIIDQIEYLYKDNGDVLTSINDINWFDDLHGSTLYVLYEIRDERKYLISSLPFTYIDSRYRKLNNDSLYEKTMDMSCTLHYQTYSKEGSIVGSFQIIHPYPTIYYNKDIKDFCWSINGQETDLVCKGLSGKDGENGQLYIAYIDTDSTDNLHNILCILGFDNSKKEYIYIAPNDFAKYGISIKDGDTIICFYAKKNDNSYELLPNINEDTSETSYFLTKTIIVPGTQTCQVYISEDTCTITTRLDMVTMFGLFDKIGLVDGCPKGLYIPYGKEEDRISGHIIWHTDGNNGPQLNVGPVKDVHNDNLEIINQDSTLNIEYSNLNFNNAEGDSLIINDKNITDEISKIETNIEDIQSNIEDIQSKLDDKESIKRSNFYHYFYNTFLETSGNENAGTTDPWVIGYGSTSKDALKIQKHIATQAGKFQFHDSNIISLMLNNNLQDLQYIFINNSSGNCTLLLGPGSNLTEVNVSSKQQVLIYYHGEESKTPSYIKHCII